MSVKKWANPGLFFCLFSSFQHVTIKIDKSVHGVLGFQTLGGRMEGTDKSTEQWSEHLHMSER